jgi:hypothetical protein
MRMFNLAMVIKASDAFLTAVLITGFVDIYCRTRYARAGEDLRIGN